MAAAAALRKALHLSYNRAAEIYGVVLVHWTQQLVGLESDLLWRILAFAGHIPQIAGARGMSMLPEAVTG